ncbi:MAG: hypothetical protein HRU50_01375 [Winogradskyella sp.]|uniref:tetratricopeptide repeat protein n=1 Tax=Winogradskyella sp. TaxID=1883156 RepID=UPI0025FC48B1|nr:hypothetical protein [Winogradskyella sp.]NRB58574.1 hypothetical protein [Winogradskyella sp.]
MNTVVKIAVIVILNLVNANIQAQTKFEKGMSKAFQLWDANKWDEAENMFERISKADEDKWLPHYYIAQLNSIKSWNTKDETILKAQLDKAQDHLDIAISKSENNAELLVLQARVYTNWIAYDGMTYGMKYAAKVTELYNKALALDSENPRVVYSKAEWEMGSAKYFGKDTAPYCQEIEDAIELFDNFKPESKFHPKWGKEQAQQIVDNCKA